MAERKIPALVKKAILDFAEIGKEPPGFVRAVLTNNLEWAVFKADDENLRCLKDIVMFCHWEIPSRAWGSEEKVEAWIKEKALGQKKEESAKAQEVPRSY